MKFAKSLSVYTLANVLAQSVPLLLLPILTKYLSEEEYGFIATLTAIASFVTPVVFWGAAAAISVEYYKIGDEKFRNYLASASVLPVICTSILTTILFFWSDTLALLLEVPGVWLVLTPPLCLFLYSKHLVGTLFRIKNRIKLFAIYEIVSAIVGVALTLIFVVNMQAGWEGRMWAVLLAAALMAAFSVCWLYLNGYFKFKLQVEYVRDVFKFGVGLLPHDFGNQIIRMSDRLFLVAIVGQSGAGQYAVAAQVSSIMLVLLSAFNQAWTPYLFSQLQKNCESAKKKIVNQTYTVISMFFVVFVVFNLCLPAFYGIFVDEKFNPSMAYVLWLTLGYFFMSAYLTYVDYIFYLKKTYLLSIVTTVNMLLNLSLNYLLIKEFGTIGSAYAFSVTMFIVMTFAFFISNHLYPMPWFSWKKQLA